MTDELAAWRARYEEAAQIADDAMATCEQLRLVILDQQQLLDSQQRTLTVAIETLERYRPRPALSVWQPH